MTFVQQLAALAAFTWRMTFAPLVFFLLVTSSWSSSLLSSSLKCRMLLRYLILSRNLYAAVAAVPAHEWPPHDGGRPYFSI